MNSTLRNLIKKYKDTSYKFEFDNWDTNIKQSIQQYGITLHDIKHNRCDNCEDIMSAIILNSPDNIHYIMKLGITMGDICTQVSLHRLYRYDDNADLGPESTIALVDLGIFNVLPIEEGSNILWSAMIDEELVLAKKLISWGCTIEADRDSLLMDICSCRSIDAFKLFIEVCGNEIVEEHKYSAIERALDNKDNPILVEYIRSHYDFSYEEALNNYSIMEAILTDNVPMIEFLITLGYTKSDFQAENNEYLKLCVQYSANNILRYLFTVEILTSQVICADNCELIRLACEYYQINTIKLLSEYMNFYI
jgi:hypothetical protein